MTNKTIFEEIKKINEIGQEYWSARELSAVLEYVKWDKFLNVIDKAKQACKNSGQEVIDQFPHMGKLIDLPKGAKRDIGDIFLTRYACYLIVQNADPSKEVVFSLREKDREITNFGIYAGVAKSIKLSGFSPFIDVRAKAHCVGLYFSPA